MARNRNRAPKKLHQVNVSLTDEQYAALCKAAHEYGGFAAGSFARGLLETATAGFTRFVTHPDLVTPLRRASLESVRDAMWHGDKPYGGTEQYIASITPQVMGGTMVGIPGVDSLTPEQAEAERKQVYAAWGLNPDGSDMEGFGQDDE